MQSFQFVERYKYLNKYYIIKEMIAYHAIIYRRGSTLFTYQILSVSDIIPPFIYSKLTDDCIRWITNRIESFILSIPYLNCKSSIILGLTCNWFYAMMISSNPLRKLQKLWLEFSDFRKETSNMNEVMQVRASSWSTMIKQRNDSVMTIKEWCVANGI